MKKTILFALFYALLFYNCNSDDDQIHNFLVEIEGNNLLCPNETIYLYIEEEYDSYLWYKKSFNETEFSALSNEISQDIYLDPQEILPATFKVEVMRNNCTITSSEFFVDVRVFIPIAVSIEGDFSIGDNGETILCTGDMLSFDILSPYNANIEWFKDDLLLEGESSTILNVNSSGIYYVKAAPDTCPEFFDQSLPLIVIEMDCN